MYTVYKHTSPSNKVYIGITKQYPPSKRWLGGKGYRTQEKFYRAIQKYGWKNFTHEILFECENCEEAEQKEKEYIAKFMSTDNRFGYNVEKGGRYKDEVSEETIRKSKASRSTPEYRAKIIEINKRRWADPEAHRKMSERFSGKNNPQYGKHQSEERKKLAKETLAPYVNSIKRKVICVETGELYESMAEAASKTGVNQRSVSQSCRLAGEREFIKKSCLHFEYAD